MASHKDTLTVLAHKLRLHPHVVTSHYDDLLPTYPNDEAGAQLAFEETVEHFEGRQWRPV